jgi:hypothetical protein
MRKVLVAAIATALLGFGGEALASPAPRAAAPPAPRAAVVSQSTVGPEALDLQGSCGRLSGAYFLCVLHARPCHGEPIIKVSRVVAIWNCRGQSGMGSPPGPDGPCIPLGNLTAQFNYYLCINHADLDWNKCRPGVKVFDIVSTWACKAPGSALVSAPSRDAVRGRAA